MGHEVCVITSDRYYPFPNFSKTVGRILGRRYVGRGTYVEEGIEVIRLPLILEFASHNIIRGLRKSLENFSPDIVHVHSVTSPTTMMTIITLKKTLNYKIVVDCHMDYSLASNSKIRHVIFYLWSRNPVCRYMLRNSDGYVAVAESARKWLSREWGISYYQIQVIPLGAESVVFSTNMLKRRRTRRKLGIRKEDVLIIYAGKLIPEKDLEILIHAAAPIINKYENVKILLIGSGSKEYIKNLLRLIESYNINRNVLFLPFQHKRTLPEYYNAGDIGVWPGQDSITIVEAMATGLPVILPRSDRNIHYLEYNNGFNFKRGNSSKLQDCLEKLVLNPDLRQQMGLRSSKLVEEKLSWDVITKQTLALYERVIG